MTSVTAARPLLRGWVHAAMTPVALLAAITLAVQTEPGAGRISVLVFAVSLVGLYAVSGTYHLGRWSARVRWLLSRADVVMIQLFIAGTFTPIAFHTLSGAWRTWSLALAWIVVGIGAAITVSPLRAPRWATALGFLSLGWLAVLPFTRIIGAIGWEGSSLIALGGALYTLGAIVYATKRPDPFPRVLGFHEIFHLLVVAASTAHYFAIWRYVLPIG